ncbi:MAG: hypothetical protein V2J25_01235 [Desulfatiglans sp.]|nr:hypothetical protein [Desulfatiglans sp.]
MRKNSWFFMAVAIMALLAVPYVASAAPVKMIFTGTYQIVGTASDNVHDFTDSEVIMDGEGEYVDAFEDETNYVTQRFRLTSIAATENVKGVIGIEIGWDEWGKSYTTQSGLGNLGGSFATGGDTGLMADTNSTNIEVRFAYVDFKIPDTGLSIAAGKQALYTHQQLVFTAAVAAPGIQALWDMGNGMNLKFWWAKLIEGVNPYSPAYGSLQGQGDSDQDFYYLELKKKFEGGTAGLYTAYERDYRELATSLGSILETPLTTSDFDHTENWFGAFANFNIGPVNLDLHGVYSTGEYEMVRNAAGDPDVDGSGWYGRVMANMKVGPTIVNAGMLYSSGDDNFEDDDYDVFGFVEAPSRFPSGSLIAMGPNLYFWGNGVAPEEYSAVCLPPSGTHNLGHWFTNLGITYPMGKWKFVAEYWYLRSVEDPADPLTYDNPHADEVIGHEFDFEIHYALTPNLTLSGEFDYLIAGDFFKDTRIDYATGDDVTYGTDDAWLLAWGIMYKF